MGSSSSGVYGTLFGTEGSLVSLLARAVSFGSQTY